ncbi:unnamed protein product [Prorocentrum cordatum]|uniref:Transmembrane protein n=1 Tax=Prorocentrum cordatum TaxID=2364126 RepID=A0ABN9Q9N1_9DINO|nr:unnamed protein product [Polarella glacialis]
MRLVLLCLCLFGFSEFQPALASSEAGVTCNPQWCRDYARDCLAGTESQPCSCEKGVWRVIDKPSHVSAFAPRFYRFTCCTEDDPYNTSKLARFTFDRDACGDYSSTHMFVASILTAIAFATGAILWKGCRVCHGYVHRPAKIIAQDENVENSTNVLDGGRLHDSIPPHRWCVTRADLQQFRRLVRRAVLDGRIQPTEADLFDPRDDVIGPCVYSVTDQYVTPVTARAGNPSWALMLHPDGLACDLFITHSWKEGIYELVDKVIYSWPAGKRHVYLCFLSNPQNLDIARLVSSPNDSPFARALRSATDMMVVSNRRESIYSRVWCTYEAHLAYTLDKRIFCATSPIHDFWHRVASQLGVCLVGLSIGAACLLLLTFIAFEHFALLVRNLLILVLCCTTTTWKYHMKIPWGTACRRSSCVAVLFGGIGVGFVWQVDMTYSMNWFGALLFLAFGLCVEADRLWAVVAVREKVNLSLGYTGHIRDAQCSVPADGELIRGELQEETQEIAVDQSVECLICTGLSTKLLRDTAQRVGKLGNVTNWNLASIVGHVGGIWVWLPAHSTGSDVCTVDHGISAFICILQGVTWSVLFVFVLSTDRKAFAATSVVTLLVCLPIRAVSICAFVFSIALVMGPLVLLLTLAGPANVARVPLVGPALVRCFIGDWDMRNSCARRSERERRRFSKELSDSQHKLASIYGKLEQDLTRDSRPSLTSTPSDLEGTSSTNRMGRTSSVSSCGGDSPKTRQSGSGIVSSSQLLQAL